MSSRHGRILHADQSRAEKRFKSGNYVKLKAAAREPEPENFTPEINDRFREALRIMGDTDASAFITGRAGTGKSRHC